MAILDQVSLLCREIERKGRAEAEKILSRAKEKAEAITRDTQAQIQGKQEGILVQKRQEAFRKARQLQDGAHLKASKLILQAKEALLQELLQAAQQRLESIRNSPEYAAVLKSFIQQAVLEIPGEERYWIQVRQEDTKLISAGVLQNLLVDDAHRFEVMEQAANITGGCLIYSFDRKMLVDFSFSALLQRARPLLRELLANELLGEAAP